VAIDRLEIRGDDRVDVPVVINLERGDAGQCGRMAPRQIDESERLGLVS